MASTMLGRTEALAFGHCKLLQGSRDSEILHSYTRRMADLEVALSYIHRNLKFPPDLVLVEVGIDAHVLREEIEA